MPSGKILISPNEKTCPINDCKKPLNTITQPDGSVTKVCQAGHEFHLAYKIVFNKTNSN
jgi:hypothetical protein